MKKSAVYDAPHMVLSNEYGHLFLTGDGNKCHEQHLGIVRIDAFVAKKWIDQIIEMENIAKGTNSLFCFLTAPDKQSIYWETLCDKEDNRNIKKIFDGLNSTIYHDPLQEIIDSNLAKEFDVYPKVDSHWCSIGAIVALQGILKKMGENFDLLSVINSCEDNSIGGDLGIKTTPRTLGVARDLKSSLWKSLLIYDNSVPDNGRIRLFENSNALVKEKILFVGDSFSYKLADIASQIFQSVFHFHGQFIDKECLRIIHPKYFIFEQTERFFIKEPKYSLDESFFQILEDKVKSNVEVKNFLNNCRVTPKNDISLNVDQLLIIDLSESYLQKLDLLEQKYSSKKLELFLQTVKKIY